jgi:seryl-tRNA(Sec) selenium transferase
MTTTTRIVDRIALAYIRRALARYRRPGDAADRLGDSLVATMQAEIRRRNDVLAAAVREAAERARRRGFQVLKRKAQ